MGAVFELGERRASCLGFATFGWVFWFHEFSIDIWRFAPLGRIGDTALNAVAPEPPDGAWFVIQTTLLIGICFLGGRIAMEMYRRNYFDSAPNQNPER